MGCHISLSCQENYRDVSGNSEKDDFLLASSLFSLVAMGAPSQALALLPGSEEQVLISFQKAAPGMSEGEKLPRA